jgi:ubiquitin carboxyl-terminal hydrolase L3
MSKKWFPLESNPVVINSYLESMGLDTQFYSFQDVLSTEEWALDMIPSPVLAVMMLYPIKPHTEEFAALQNNEILDKGQVVSSKTFFMKQNIGNACGTIGILHALGNSQDSLTIRNNSYLSRFFAATSGLNADEIATYLEADDELETVHAAAASEGQSDQMDGEVDTHFVCFW